MISVAMSELFFAHWNPPLTRQQLTEDVLLAKAAQEL